MEVQTLADEVRIYEDQRLLAVHPLLAGRGQRRVAPGHIAWVSLDAGDNEPTRFWGYVLSALAILFLMPKSWRRFVPPQLLALVVGSPNGHRCPQPPNWPG